MKIIIDPGHGGKYNGARSKDIHEDDLNLAISTYLYYELYIAGHDVKLTREADVEVGLQERCDIAEEFGGDVFLSIHCDSVENKDVEGMGTFISRSASGNSFTLSHFINQAMEKDFSDHNHRSTKRANYYVLREENNKTPVRILIECEFMSNEKQRAFLREPENQRALAQAICKAVNKYSEVQEGW